MPFPISSATSSPEPDWAEEHPVLATTLGTVAVGITVATAGTDLAVFGAGVALAGAAAFAYKGVSQFLKNGIAEDRPPAITAVDQIRPPPNPEIPPVVIPKNPIPAETNKNPDGPPPQTAPARPPRQGR